LRKKRLIVLTTIDDPMAAIGRGDIPSNTHNDSAGNRKQFDMELLRQYLNQYPCINYNRAEWIDKLLYCLPITGMLRQRPRMVEQFVDLDDTPLLRP
jgi:hypothetical protein